ncbi:DEDD exonuclease domain-containing protein [Nocardioides marmoribigeumensis]|uniref:DNA polymerase-3 subunit epsilon n=1 Tax=Nocardioides marmoribigeumensis TaxID=433649 RepID=A0ABU2BPK5_9ACTN|nr:DEDD exonuclease domain-containing protein [Nocardioides marmoribigeumensis]MDR7360560.1 DNA polymerase-3 subunit epsilon [Nocardioides marmoribigeumensis]
MTTTAEPTPQGSRGWERQLSFDELGRPLRDVTFCVVDLETTGASVKAGCRITEIGAVKVRGGEVLGEFQTLVNPAEPIPAFISVLTGITDSMVATSPRIEQVLPQFLEFAAGCVMVAHNAPFDMGFLQHACAEQQRPWPKFEVVDTAVLARRIVRRDEAPNCKLSSLAVVFGATTTPNHRALSDARATVDVLHGLIGRLGNLGVHTVEELRTYTSRVTTAQRRKRHLAEHLQDGPGVYLFRDARDRVLYVGTSKHVRTRVRGYFTASETRSRMGQMVNLAERVEGIPCATPLEAHVREIRLIGLHKPSFNRRSRHPERVTWLKLTNEPWPRLSLVKRVLDDDADYLGPFRSRRAAEEALDALHEAFPLRQCTGRMAKRPSLSPCVLAEMGKCLSPCDRSVDEATYAETVEAVRDTLRACPSAVIEPLDERMRLLSAQERFEEASRFRDRLTAFLRGATRSQRLHALTRCPEIVAARREDGEWRVHVIRHGRLAAAGVIPRGADASLWVTQLSASAETVLPGFGPLPAASAEEAETLLRWLESDGVRLVHVDGDWSCPVRGAERHTASYSPAAVDLDPFG